MLLLARLQQIGHAGLGHAARDDGLGRAEIVAQGRAGDIALVARALPLRLEGRKRTICLLCACAPFRCQGVQDDNLKPTVVISFHVQAQSCRVFASMRQIHDGSERSQLGEEGRRMHEKGKSE